jgi:ribosome-binding protein aMBF1 (putative translation factor)
MRTHEASPNALPGTLAFVKKHVPAELRFHERLATMRRERSLTQHALAEMVGMHISQIRRYESG